MLGLVGTLGGDTEVRRLLGGEGGEADTKLAQVGSGNLLVELLGQHVHANGVLGGVGPQLNLGKDLLLERKGGGNWISK